MAKNRSSKDKKLKRKVNQREQIIEQAVVFDVPELLKLEPFDTKPEVGAFLKKYVKSIRLLVDFSKITVYPVTDYAISKVFVDFLDGHQIIADLKRDPMEYCLWNGLDELEMKSSEEKSVAAFMQRLQEFGFVG